MGDTIKFGDSLEKSVDQMLELNIEYKEAKTSPIKATLKHQIESRESQVDRKVYKNYISVNESGYYDCGERLNFYNNI